MSKKAFFCYLFFISVTTIRFFLEHSITHFTQSPIYLIFHHHYWYFFVFLLFIFNFRVFLKLKIKDMLWMLFLSPVILTPILYYWIRGTNLLKLQYINGNNLIQSFPDVLTFMLFHSKNWPVSIELILLFVSIAVFSFYKTRKFFLSLFVGFSCYFCLMIFAATALIGPYETDVLIYVKTSLNRQLFLVFLYFSAVATLFILLFKNEIALIYMNKRFLISGIILFVLFIIFALLFLLNPFLQSKPFCLGDFGIIFIPLLVLSQSLLFLFFYREKKWLYLKIFLSFHSLVVFLGLFLHFTGLDKKF